jgi:hypothetical protein
MLGLGGILSNNVTKRFATGVGASYGLAGCCHTAHQALRETETGPKRTHGRQRSQ